MTDLIIAPGLLVTLGFLVGVLGGFFGVGGAFLMTPTLNLLGFPMVQAIGTDLALMLGSSSVATFRHLRFGNVDIALGLYMLAGTIFGVWIGKEAVFALAAAGYADSVIRGVYIVLLFSLAVFMFYDWRVHTRGGTLEPTEEPTGTRLSRMLCRYKLGPCVSLPVSRIPQVSVWVPVTIGLATGFLASLLGVGGGFIRMPALLYGLGVPTTVAVGTDLFEIIFSSAFGTFLYALEGQVHLPAAMIMLVGAMAGAQVGAYATVHVRGIQIRLYFSITILFAGIGVALKQIAAVTGDTSYATAAVWLVLSATSALVLFISAKLGIALAKQRASKSAS